MSRIGKQPIPIPDKVSVDLKGKHIKVKGPKGELERDIHERIDVKVEDGIITVHPVNDWPSTRALHGLFRSLINNMVIGVSEGYSKSLEIIGVGYRVEQQGKGIKLSLGFSHPVIIEPPEGISLTVENQTAFTVHGIDKEAVGQVAADIRSEKPPEPYKGKGIRYKGEYVRRKVRKTVGVI
ncbi:MAG: 50S ribosomal protein L6 [bacterium]|nr:50S ribosomal protein L6 [bacterium]